MPRIVGYVHLNNVASACARVRLISYDETGVALGSDYTDTECASDNSHQSFAVEELGQPGAASAKVVLQSLGLDGTWSPVGSHTKTYGPIVDTDDPQINRATFDFGSGDLDGGNPTGTGTLEWAVSGGGTLTPHLIGTLFINDTTECARMRMRFTGQLGGVETNYGGTVCGENDELKRFGVDLAPYSSPGIESVKVSIEKYSGYPAAWSVVGSTTEYLD